MAPVEETLLLADLATPVACSSSVPVVEPICAGVENCTNGATPVPEIMGGCKKSVSSPEFAKRVLPRMGIRRFNK
jgi:hypothetical protein